MKSVVLLCICGMLLSACQLDLLPSAQPSVKEAIPLPPDYSNQKYWASLPDIKDAADSVPYKSNLKNEQENAKADIFFIYPTIYIKVTKTNRSWNADLADENLNRQIQETTILNQASVFNGACKIYVPYYRQAHLSAFYTTDKVASQKALDLAYEDVKKAFQYYLVHYNHGRPIVIASHSQGSYHAARLVKEFFDGKELQKQLVAAYLIGFPIRKDAFDNISPSEDEETTGVWASWNTFGRNYYPENYEAYYKDALSTNPLLWNSKETFAGRDLNHGGVGLHFTFKEKLVDAQSHNGLLWVNKPYIKGRWLMPSRSWHRADINFFYTSIRENVAVRIDKFLESNKVFATRQ